MQIKLEVSQRALSRPNCENFGRRMTVKRIPRSVHSDVPLLKGAYASFIERRLLTFVATSVTFVPKSESRPVKDAFARAIIYLTSTI